jgi:hypothetical protein
LIPGSVPADDSNADGDELVAVNTSGFARREIAKIPLATARALSDAAIQISHDGAAYVLFDNSAGDQVVSATAMNALAEAIVAPARGGSSRRLLLSGVLLADQVRLFHEQLVPWDRTLSCQTLSFR